jgi:uncharacterized protein (DUF1330 family)
MAFEMVVALHLSNEEQYAEYREGMTPLLHAYGGGFRFDFVVSTVLASEDSFDINRVFTIHFPDRKSRDKFFADPRYLQVRERFFEPSVASRVVIAEYDRA